MKQPPHLAQKLLKWYAGRADLEDIQGDLDEVYSYQKSVNGKLKADLGYWMQILSLLFSYGLKKRKKGASYSTHYYKNSMTMLKNYFKIAYRNLRKQKTFTAINVIGLSIGMSIALLAVAMYIDLNQFDTYHENAEDIYRVITKTVQGGDTEKYGSSPPALTYRMDDEIPGIYKSVHIDAGFSILMNHRGNSIRAFGYYTEPSFFDVFDFELESGSPEILNEPGKVILTKELATKLYGEQSAIDKVIESERWGQLQVAGVLKDFPQQTHLAFDMLVGFSISSKFDANFQSSNWIDFTSSYYYFAIPSNQKKQLQAQMREFGKRGDSHFEAEEVTATYELQALLDITPGPLINDGIGVQFDMPTMILFFGISLLILLPACFNYTNMSIAIALKRSKEVGIRKVMGSHKRPIVNQFLIETVIICLCAVAISGFVFIQIREGFTSMLAGGTSISFEVSPILIFAFVGFAVLTGVLTGLGPALYFAKISPIQALRSGGSNEKVSISGIRKGLLVFQFALTLIFMIGVGALLKQYQDAKSFELPFATDDTFIVYTQDMDIELLKTEFQNEAQISNVSFSSSIPGTSLTKSIYTYYPEKQDSVRLREVYVDDQFMDHMNLEFQWGEKLTNKSHQIEHVVVNSEMIKRLKLMEFPDTTELLLKDGERARIVGVIENYNHEPLNESIEPMMIRIGNEDLAYAIVHIPNGDKIASTKLLENTWDELFPNVPFKATMLENEIHAAYDFFRAGLRIFGFLAMLAVSVSCLGLLGMVIYSTENRTKEVAIRKILGASRQSLFGSLASLFIKLWSIALLFAIPISYFFYDNMLVRIYNKFGDGVGLLEILLSVAVTLGLGALAIFWQVNKVARINPANNLRNE